MKKVIRPGRDDEEFVIRRKSQDRSKSKIAGKCRVCFTALPLNGTGCHYC